MTTKFWIRFGVFSVFMACILEIGIEVYSASKYKGYNSMLQSISYLGNPESPTYQLIRIWNVIFSVLFVFFAIGFYKAFIGNFSKTKIAMILILVYGISQGFGAGIFTMDALKTKNTWENVAHNIFSVIGDIALILFPIIMMYYFTKFRRTFTRIVSVVGILFALLFICAKFELIQEIMHYKGLWQRLYQGIYYMYFLFVACTIVKKGTNISY